MLLAIYDYPLTIVEAPMGFGKTTAIRDFFVSDKNPPLWIAFLNADDSTSFIWNSIAAEVGKLNDEAGIRLKSLGLPVDAPQRARVLSILNDLDFKDKTVFVIDDYHLSQNLQVNKLFKQIVMERLDNLHIVIITRDTSNFDFAELFSKGMCQVISQQHLKLTKEEIRAFALMMDENIAESDIEKISEYTDGWISLIYMVLLGLPKGIPVGMNKTIDELIENVLFNAYGEHIQKFLLKLSIMDNFTAKQAWFITQEEKTNEFLKKLCKENAFVFYDEATKFYKIHNVLLDFLRIKQRFTTEELQDLYRRLGEWHLGEKEYIAAYSCLYRAGEVERILADIDKPDRNINNIIWFDGHLEMFKTAPQILLDEYPIAYLLYIFISLVRRNKEMKADCIRRLDNLEQVYLQRENIDEDYRNSILAEILIIRKFTVFNEVEQMSARNDEIIRLLNGRQSRIMIRSNEYTFGSPHLLYIYFREQGTLQTILGVILDKFPLFPKYANGCGTGSEYQALAEYALETGDWKAAELNSFKTIYKAKTYAQASLIICANFNLIRLYIYQGKIEQALEILKQLEKDISAENNRLYNTTIELCKGYIYSCLGQLEKIPYWLQIGDMTAADLFLQGMTFNYIIYGKAVMLFKNYIELEMLAESFKEYFAIFSSQLGFIHNNIFEAVAKYNLYGLKEGTAALERALVKGEADNIMMPFVENAPHIIDMLKVISNNNAKNEYIKRVLLCSEQYIESLKSTQIIKVKLSQREVEVLSLSAEGLKREEIASHLTMSQATVKTHLQNIYQKLEANGKVSAIKIAQKHGII